jgi:pyruvate/2-oxoacid:ferredoxin oxidoreductase beta subunit
MGDTMEVGRLAVKTGIFPVYEIIDGKMFLSKESERCLDSTKRVPVEEYFKMQKRFNNIDPAAITIYQEYVDNQWDFINKML